MHCTNPPNLQGITKLLRRLSWWRKYACVLRLTKVTLWESANLTFIFITGIFLAAFHFTLTVIYFLPFRLFWSLFLVFSFPHFLSLHAVVFSLSCNAWCYTMLLFSHSLSHASGLTWPPPPPYLTSLTHSMLTQRDDCGIDRRRHWSRDTQNNRSRLRILCSIVFESIIMISIFFFYYLWSFESRLFVASD